VDTAFFQLLAYYPGEQNFDTHGSVDKKSTKTHARKKIQKILKKVLDFWCGLWYTIGVKGR
jgi:hypothetical protein